MNLVLFDVCGTLIDGNSTQLYVDYLLENGPVNFRAKHYKRWKPFFSLIAWIFRKFFHLDITRLIIRKCFSGIKQEEITNLNKKFSSFYLKKLKNHEHFLIEKQKWKTIILVSASIDPPIQILAEFLSVPYYASKLEQKNNILTWSVTEDLQGRKESIFKDNRINLNDYKKISFYTDNKEDISLISYLHKTKKLEKVNIILLSQDDRLYREHYFTSLKFTNYEYLS